MARSRLTFRRLVGLDRSGPPPPETLHDAPWRVWTIPNVIGFVRLALIPVFVALAVASDTGTEPLPAVLFAVIAWSDYLDGIAARLTGQYSRLGAILDPVVDRTLVAAGGFVVWYHELLPRWALYLLMAREVFMLAAGRVWLRHGLDLKVNWPGRLAVWPLMTALFAALVGLTGIGEVLLYVGLALAWVATAMYLRDGWGQLAAGRAAEAEGGGKPSTSS